VRDDVTSLREDFVRARRRALARVLADSAGVSDLADELEVLAERDLPLSYFDELVTKVGAATLDEIAGLVAEDLDETRMVVVVSGPEPDVVAAFEAAGIEAEILRR
jgi:zinc protease